MQDFKELPSNPNYLVNKEGIIFDKQYNRYCKVDNFKGRSPQVPMMRLTGGWTNRSVKGLIKETYPELFEIVAKGCVIYHVEGTMPNEPLNEIQIKLRKLFSYNPKTGELLDLKTGSSPCHKKDGYNGLNRYGFKMSEHRLIMLYMLGKVFPNSEIDHINHVRDDNRWCNLRIVDRKFNSMNLSQHKRNTSGVSGVAWHKQRNKWRAFIMIDYKQIALGLFTEFEDAVKARKEAEQKYNFHDNHGNKRTIS
jgi:hypothetical protein